MKFKNRTWRERKQQAFDRENIFITVAGKKINVYDKIQEAREDTEIYPTLEKYGCLPQEFKNEEEVRQYLNGHVSEIHGNIDLRTVSEAKLQAENLFYSLPLNIRSKFDNDIKRFEKEGYKYLDNMNKEYEAKQKEIAETQATAQKEEITTNE